MDRIWNLKFSLEYYVLFIRVIIEVCLGLFTLAIFFSVLRLCLFVFHYVCNHLPRSSPFSFPCNRLNLRDRDCEWDRDDFCFLQILSLRLFLCLSF